jgi:hypothetical protein
VEKRQQAEDIVEKNEFYRYNKAGQQQRLSGTSRSKPFRRVYFVTTEDRRDGYQ